ncbi:hypothetical protein RhiLY_00685 [Ceratobasidium sp. AG-Ba]|nr:hypothetical protein RhiLY_00685 [Ceratobasidium sp. AG-Ba]
MSSYDPDSDPTYHVPGTTAVPIPSIRSVTPRPKPDDDDDMHDPFEDTPSYGYTSSRPPPIMVEKSQRNVAYAPVNPSDFHNDTYTDPYTPFNHSDDHVPLVNLNNRSRAEEIQTVFDRTAEHSSTS